jgi:hypothetical protein
MSLSMAFGISETDVFVVLRQNAALVTNSEGKTFDQMADDIFDSWVGGVEPDRIAQAALDGGTDMDEQTTAAHAEIRAILVEEGILKR